MKAKHFWYAVSSGERGRIAARINVDRFEVHQIGKAAPVTILPALIRAMVDMEECERLHRSRKHRYATEVRTGMSGCKDLFLIEELDRNWQDFPMHKLLHVSMYGNLNEDASVWLGDIPVLLDMLGESDGVELKECPSRSYKFRRAFESEELYEEDERFLSEETLERLRALQLEDYDGDDDEA